MIAYKFVKWDVKPLETLKSSDEYILADKMSKGDKLTKAEEGALIRITKGFQSYADLGGWRFTFPYLKTFYYEQYGQVYKGYALNKTCLRKAIYGRIDSITEKI
jgi:hypothetical protein